MILRKIDLDYWQQRQIPSWGDGLQENSVRVTIDAIVNKNGHEVRGKLDNDLHNAVHLLRLVRKNGVHDFHNTGKTYSLVGYMERYEQKDGRRKLYKRWVRKFNTRQRRS